MKGNDSEAVIIYWP